MTHCCPTRRSSDLVIEAHHLFGVAEDRIEVLVHPQSVIHSMVAYVDGSVLAQLGTPDMRTPIAYTLAWPDRMPTPSQRLDLAALARLTFEAPDPNRFPALRSAEHTSELQSLMRNSNAVFFLQQKK